MDANPECEDLPAGEPPALNGTAKTILVVEENLKTRRVLRSQLERKGFAVLEASDADEALGVARKERIDLILLDLLMPKLGEDDLLGVFKEDPATEHVPVLIVSVVESAESGILPGAHGFLRKPFREEELMFKIQTLLGDRNRSILVADDNPGVRASLQMQLEDLGYPLHWQILIALVLAVIVGVLFGDKALIFDPLGVIFLNALKMIVVPLIVCSIVTGVANIGGHDNFGRMGAKTLAYYITTSLFAIVTGLAFVNLVQPGVGADLGLQQDTGAWAQALEAKASGSPWQTILDLMIRMVPTNPVQAMVEGDMIQVIVFCLLFGYFSTKVAEPYRSLIRDFFQGGFEIMMKLTQVIILFAPIGIFGLVTKIVATAGIGAFKNLGLYALTVFAALAMHAVVTLPLLLLAGGQGEPAKALQGHGRRPDDRLFHQLFLGHTSGDHRFRGG